MKLGKHRSPTLSKSSSTDFPIVGIGASAGGLAAFEAFFSGIPATSNLGMAIVLVQHLEPDHKISLTKLIQRSTRMKVFEVTDGIKVQINCVYVIPPNHDLVLENRQLRLYPPREPHGHRLPIDFFFESLATEQRHKSIGIILSGTGQDGTVGARAIKSNGGMIIAQNLETTEYDEMPQSVIAQGLANFTLDPDKMAAALIDRNAVPAQNKKALVQPVLLQNLENGPDGMQKIFAVLRARTGHDFSRYKPSTIQRRIERRLTALKIDSVREYATYLEKNPTEANTLFQDLLIGVTSFFRNPEAYDILQNEVIPKLFEDKAKDSVIRVWVAGCSTGEEAYSIAILIKEYIVKNQLAHPVQIFATDIDARAIVTARAGIYSSDIAPSVGTERLTRFFAAEADGRGYRIRKDIRDLIIFSELDVIKDPPFSRLDLVSCRNLMIYLGSELQKRLIPLFHYALNPQGILFLGSSEGISEFENLFSTLNRDAKLFKRKKNGAGTSRNKPDQHGSCTL